MVVSSQPRTGLSTWKKLRLRTVMRFARIMGVPVDIHGSFFPCRKNEPKTSGFGAGPK